ncbi:MAG: PD-(D/E)XK nuclease family protein [Bradymonadia bacterium]
MSTPTRKPSIDEHFIEDDLAALEAFVLDNQPLAELEQLLAGFNLFEILGNTRREERHSDFLAFLLDPSQPHGFGDACLQAFMQAAIDGEAIEPSGLRKIDIALLDLSDAKVERERDRIDILVTSEAERCVMLVENKVDTDEHSNQLHRYLELTRHRYPEWSILPVFLTRDRHSGTHPAYHAVGYEDVHRILTQQLEHRRTSLPPDVEVAVRHYVELLERHIMEDTRIAELARKIYARHARALDIIFEHRPDALDHIRRDIVDAIEARPELRLINASKSCVQFVPTAWDEIPTLRDGGDGTWFKSRELMRFEFKLQDGLSLHLLVGPGEHDTRKALYEESGTEANTKIFKHRSNALSPRWSQLWRLRFSSKKFDAESSIETRVEKFREVWREYLSRDLPKLTQVFIDLSKGGF